MQNRMIASMFLLSFAFLLGNTCPAATLNRIRTYTCESTDGTALSQVVNKSGTAVLTLQVGGGGASAAGGVVKTINSAAFSLEFLDQTPEADDDLLLIEVPVSGTAQLLSLDNNPSLPVTKTVLSDGWTRITSTGTIQKVAQKYYGFEIRNYRVNPASIYIRNIKIGGQTVSLTGGGSIPCSDL